MAPCGASFRAGSRSAGPVTSNRLHLFMTIASASPVPTSTLQHVSKGRWGAALLLGTVLWVTALIASEFVPQVVLGMAMEGSTYALVGILRGAFGLAAIALALRLVRLRLRNVEHPGDRGDLSVVLMPVPAD